MRAVWLPLLIVSGLAGCADDAPREPDADVPVPALPADPWAGTDRQLLMDVRGESIQFDVLCVFGGGVEMRRAGGRVLPGTAHVEALVATTATSTGLQLGYAITRDAGYDEREQDGITWLEPVVNGERRFTIPVRADQVEPADGPLLWHFYQRMNLPTGENMPKPDCYTGAHSGEMTLRAEAVKG